MECLLLFLLLFLKKNKQLFYDENRLILAKPAAIVLCILILTFF